MGARGSFAIQTLCVILTETWALGGNLKGHAGQAWNWSLKGLHLFQKILNWTNTSHPPHPPGPSCTYFGGHAAGVAVWGFEIPTHLPLFSIEYLGKIRTIMIAQHRTWLLWPIGIALICPRNPTKRGGKRAGISIPWTAKHTALTVTAHHPRRKVQGGQGGWKECRVLVRLFSEKVNLHFKVFVKVHISFFK